MKKAVLGGVLIVGCVYMLSLPAVSNAIILFMFAGIVPGTRTALPFWAMSLVLGTIAAIALHWLLKQPLFIGDTVAREKHAKAEARAEVRRSIARRSTATSPAKSRSRRRYQPITSI